jgi:hypothetical protein
MRDGDCFDSERTSETARDLMDAAEVRQIIMLPLNPSLAWLSTVAMTEMDMRLYR